MAITVLQPKGVSQPLGMYSHGMEANGLVVVAGQVGVKPDGGLAGTDAGSQTKQAFANVAAVLGAAGCRMRDIVRLQTFLTSADDIPAFMAARQDVFPVYFRDGAYPPNTLLVISRLVRPELRVEIEAIAIKPPRAASKPQTRRARPARRPARRR
ncbi:MAG: RidA family protein [Candidatus Rokuibacteriota bacterium]|nr:MAG: RidA family protein [Candidatus Rokubacteria bacterium]